MVSIYMLLTLILCSIILPFLTPNTYYETHLSMKNTAPNLNHYFGTDDLGRSMYARIWWGARISLFIGTTAAFIDMVIGVSYGAFAGLAGGKTEEIMMRIADIFYSLPYLLVVILLTVVMKQGIFTIILAMTLTGWIKMARIIRAETLSLKEQDFVLAALSLGTSRRRILLKHIIPNCFGTIITAVTLTIPHAIFTEAFLSFLGLGVRAPVASWGVMASDGLGALAYYPWRLFFPAAFITITMLAFNLLGNGLRDAFDPRLR
ncbi:MAG: Oligopeptide transport system permease protein OppC [Chlamydiia bacterium]|nr:Oligopeptide transport system permease protein OppC [Chlamydiia bacterium]MCH9618918.1 Oligopeptide transport system permease protein OppC [Chlamydiia bacterium]